MSKYLKILLFSLVAFMGCEDAVRINWNCSFGRTESEWEEISSLYEVYYKITTIVE